MTRSSSSLANRANHLILLIGLTLLTASCASIQYSPAKHSNHINFLIHTDDESSKTYGSDNDTWKITTHLITKKETPKTFFYNFVIHSLVDTFKVSEIKYKYGEYGKWRLLQKEQFLTQVDNEHMATQHTLYKIPITIKKVGVAHKQIFHVTVKTKNGDEVYLTLVFGVNKCIAKKIQETLCF